MKKTTVFEFTEREILSAMLNELRAHGWSYSNARAELHVNLEGGFICKIEAENAVLGEPQFVSLKDTLRCKPQP
jgi:hypothetical protein